MACRKQTVKEALAVAKRSKGRALSAQERRIVSNKARRSPVLICGKRRSKR